MKTLHFKHFIWLAFAAAVVSCSNQKEDLSLETKTQYNISALAGSPYYALMEKDQEVFARYWYMDMHLFMDQAEEYKYVKNNMPNNYYLGSSQQNITISDNCMTFNNGTETDFYINRIISLNDGADSLSIPYYSHIANINPIEFIRPYSTNCNSIPCCYVKDMEIAWNPDYDNRNGVVILVEWQGSTVSEPTRDIHIVTGDIVADNGQVVLRDELFNDIPNEAIVNLWIMRANMGEVIARESRDETYQRLLRLLTSYELGESQREEILSIINEEPLPITTNGSVALLPIILMREM